MSTQPISIDERTAKAICEMLAKFQPGFLSRFSNSIQWDAVIEPTFKRGQSSLAKVPIQPDLEIWCIVSDYTKRIVNEGYGHIKFGDACSVYLIQATAEQLVNFLKTKIIH